LAWDANLDAPAGYRVHVGTESGAYSEAYDVGDATTFRYTDGVPGTLYYFAVVAYNANGEVSPYSNEVSTVVGSQEPGLMRSTSDGDAGEHADGVRRIAASFDIINAIAALPDGRALLIEGARHVRVLGRDGAVSAPTLTSETDEVALTDLAIDPAFEQTSAVFVGLTAMRRDGGREFRVVRYRLVAGSLGEGVAVVGGLAYRGEGSPRHAVDPAGHVYVAMPSGSSRDFGTNGILRFAADGSVPRENPAWSPVIASGLRSSSDLDWDDSTLWLVGADERFPSAIARLPLDTWNAAWPRELAGSDLRLPANLSVTAFDVTTVITAGARIARGVLIDSQHRLYRLERRERGAVAMEQIAWPTNAVPVDAAIGARGNVYVVTKTPANTFAIAELIARP
jgi:hypothetical protein